MVYSQQQLSIDVMRLARHQETENWDPWFGQEPPVNPAQALHRERWTTFYQVRWADFSAAAALLADDASRTLLYQLILYRILGHRHVRLPQNTPQYWQWRQEAAAHLIERNVVPMWQIGLDRFRFDGMTYLSYAGAVLTLHWCRQYCFERDGVRIAPAPGDVVLDAGAFVGDTSLVFAHAVGETGHVYAFEFVPNNVAILETNLAANPHLAHRITHVPHAVARTSGETFHYMDHGPATGFTDDPAEATGSVESRAIDDFVAAQGLARVDFIKMDVEGVEAEALRGAAETIRRFRPKLAISAYHNGGDFIELPTLIKQLLPEYRLYLDHHTIREQETVLYAMPPT